MRLFPSVAVLLSFLALSFALESCGGGAEDLVIPTVYLIAGRVADPTTNPFTPLPGARVWVETDPTVAAVTTDANGDFLIHGVPSGVQRLRAELAGRVSSISTGILMDQNVDNAGLPLFTKAEIDSILQARGAAPWDTTQALFGLFALRSNDVPLGGATILLTPSPPYAGGALYQTGNSADPIVVDNAIPGQYSLSVTNPGFVWDNPFPTRLEAGIVTFGTPRARPNITGFLFDSRSTGNAIGGAGVGVYIGPTGGSVITDFLGQFSLVGLAKGTYVLRAEAGGYLPAVTWPQNMQSDTTLTFLMTASDSLAAWSLANGGPAVVTGMGHLLVEARNAAGGARILGATLSVTPAAGFAIAQSARTPAVLLNLSPGSYQVTVTGGGVSGMPTTKGVTVRANEVTTSRLDLPTSGTLP